MECPRCHFENMPGLAMCFRCGSVLTSRQVTIDVHPPRASTMGKPFRSIQRWLRRWFYLEKVEPSGAAITKAANAIKKSAVLVPEVLGTAFFQLSLAIVPGLLQLVDGRFREVRWYCLGWLVLMGIGAFMYGSGVALFAVGLAVGMHGWLTVMGWKLILPEENRISRLGAIFPIILFFGLGYWMVGTRITSYFPGSFSAFDIPHYEIQKGDFLLGRNRGRTAQRWARGEVVLAEVFQLTNYGVSSTRFETIGQVVGLPGETVAIKDGQYFVNDRALDKQRYPVPVWLKGLTTQMSLADGYYFISCEYTLAGHGGNDAMILGAVRDGCVMREDRILAKMTLRWLPLWRRGYLKESS